MELVPERRHDIYCEQPIIQNPPVWWWWHYVTLSLTPPPMHIYPHVYIMWNGGPLTLINTCLYILVYMYAHDLCTACILHACIYICMYSDVWSRLLIPTLNHIYINIDLLLALGSSPTSCSRCFSAACKRRGCDDSGFLQAPMGREGGDRILI